MALTKEEIWTARETLITNPYGTVTLSDGRSYTMIDIDKLWAAQDKILEKLDVDAGINRGPFFKCNIDLT